ncbi:MAG: GNAT family N-acetyltransferase [Desulfobacterales bacterium]|nr:GNAT family N-acetyltransferase [Desulfobacterales bacterium]
MIRRAKNTENKFLTSLSFDSKRYWNYPEAYFKIWKTELTITQDYIWENDVFVYEKNQRILGYYSVVDLKSDLTVSDILIEAGTWLEHIFISPESIQKGIGTKLFLDCVKLCQSKEVDTLKILADPNSSGFYEKMRCQFIKDYPSTIEGRTTPYFEYYLN